MAKGNLIVVSAEPQGRFVEGYIATGETPKPGQVVQIKASAGIDDTGNFTWEIYNADADGGRPKGPLGVLDIDHMQGKTATQAYVAGARCFVYIPYPGDELNMLLADVGGTADAHSFGEMLIVDDTTGKLIATTGTPETEPFMLLEDVTAPTADTLVHVIYTGY